MLTKWRAWQPIPGMNYEASNDGLIRRVGTTYIMKQSLRADGYYQIRLHSKTYKVHYLVALAWHGTPATGLEVRHMDGVRTNNQWTNLRYGTRSENMQDKDRHGTNHHANKTHCPSGHEYNEFNTRYYKGKRICRACDWARRPNHLTERGT